MNKSEQIDIKDLEILNILSENSRLSYRQIAKKAKVSVATAMNRVKALEKKNVIRNYTININHDNLNYEVPVIIDVRIAKGKLFEVENKIANHPNVYAVYDNTGHFDATLIAKFKTRRAMDTFLKKIQSYDFVERTETKFILNTLKENSLKVL